MQTQAGSHPGVIWDTKDHLFKVTHRYVCANTVCAITPATDSFNQQMNLRFLLVLPYLGKSSLTPSISSLCNSESSYLYLHALDSVGENTSKSKPLSNYRQSDEQVFLISTPLA